jgi:hypothetical protein
MNQNCGILFSHQCSTLFLDLDFQIHGSFRKDQRLYPRLGSQTASPLESYHASIIKTLKCIHPSAYAASLMTSSNGALNGTGAPCNTGSARITSLLLGNKDGRILFNAEPIVCTSRFGVNGGIRVCTILKEPRVEDADGEDGI